MGSLIEHGRDASGQMYRRNRYYDPASGRFTQEDPLGLAGGMNLYGFADGDPVNFGDPFGLCPECQRELSRAFENGDLTWDPVHERRIQRLDPSIQKQVRRLLNLSFA